MESLIDLLFMLLIAGICGAVAQAVFGFRKTNFFVSIVIGLFGAYIGTYLAMQFGFPQILTLSMGGSPIDIVWAICGSGLVLLVFNTFRRYR